MALWPALLLCSSLSRGGCLAYFSFVYLPLASSSCCWLSTLVYWFISQVGGSEGGSKGPLGGYPPEHREFASLLGETAEEGSPLVTRRYH